MVEGWPRRTMLSVVFWQVGITRVRLGAAVTILASDYGMYGGGKLLCLVRVAIRAVSGIRQRPRGDHGKQGGRVD